MESMRVEIEGFIIRENPLLLVRIAEEIGHDLGVPPTTQFVGIYQTIRSELNRCFYLARNKQDLSSIVTLKPKLALAVAKIDFRQRPSFEKFHYAVIDGIDCVLSAQGPEVYGRLKRFNSFIEAIFCYQQYAKGGGLESRENPEIKRLSDKINEQQFILNKLNQFVSSSSRLVNVFLSYSHNDKLFVEMLKLDLEKRGINTWHDDDRLDIGDIVSDVIAEGIKQSWCFLIVVSPQSINSNWVKYELDEAYDAHISKGKRILPVLIGKLGDEEIPQRLKKHLWADFRDESRYDKALDKLYRAIVKEGAKMLSPEAEV